MNSYKVLGSPQVIVAEISTHDKLSNGRPYKMLTVLDEYTREALYVKVATRRNALAQTSVHRMCHSSHELVVFFNFDTHPCFFQRFRERS